MLSIGIPAPPFTLPGVQAGRVRRFSLADHADRWVALFFYPADFSFVCPTEVRGFQALYPAFTAAGAEVLGVSVDPPDLHLRWVEELGGIDYPLLSDEAREVSRRYGVLDAPSGRAQRATFILRPGGTIEYLLVSPTNVGRSIEETLRVLRALQSGQQCPAGWQPE